MFPQTHVALSFRGKKRYSHVCTYGQEPQDATVPGNGQKDTPHPNHTQTHPRKPEPHPESPAYSHDRLANNLDSPKAAQPTKRQAESQPTRHKCRTTVQAAAHQTSTWRLSIIIKPAPTLNTGASGRGRLRQLDQPPSAVWIPASPDVPLPRCHHVRTTATAARCAICMCTHLASEG